MMDQSSEVRSLKNVRNLFLWSLLFLLGLGLLGCAPLVEIGCNEGISCDTTVVLEEVHRYAIQEDLRSTQAAISTPLLSSTDSFTVGDPIYLILDMYRVPSQDCEDDCSENGYIDRSIYAIDSAFLQQEDGSILTNFDIYLDETDIRSFHPAFALPTGDREVTLLGDFSPTLTLSDGVSHTVEIGIRGSGIRPSRPDKCEGIPDADCFNMAQIKMAEELFGWK